MTSYRPDNTCTQEASVACTASGLNIPSLVPIENAMYTGLAAECKQGHSNRREFLAHTHEGVEHNMCWSTTCTAVNIAKTMSENFTLLNTLHS